VPSGVPAVDTVLQLRHHRRLGRQRRRSNGGDIRMPRNKNLISQSLLRAVPLVVAGLAWLQANAAAQQFTMKLATVTINDPNFESIKEFKARIEPATQRRIKAELYPAAQLGGIPRLLEGIQLGTIEWFSTPPSFLKGVDSRFQVIESPGVFESPRHAHRTITDPGFREPWRIAGVAKGVKAISLWMYGGSAYASTTPIRTLNDFKGKKFRVLATKLETGLMSKLGAAGIPIDFAEVLPALQQRTVDGVRSNIIVMGGSKYYSVTKFVTVTNDSYIPIVAFVSTAWLNKLPQDLRDTVEKLGRDMENDMFKVAQEFDARVEKLWTENGAEVIKLSAADQGKLMEHARAVTDEYIASQPDLQEMFKLMVATAAKHKGS
jgi:C4-dicarboxylate-binding protein DctP